MNRDELSDAIVEMVREKQLEYAAVFQEQDMEFKALELPVDFRSTVDESVDSVFKLVVLARQTEQGIQRIIEENKNLEDVVKDAKETVKRLM